MERTSRFVSPAVAALALAACDPAPQQPVPGEAPSPAPSASAAAADSILRPEVLPEPIAAPLAPLEITIPFADGGARPGTAAEALLAGLLESEQLAQGWPLVLRGHTDSAGHDEANLRVARRRAEAVAGWLAEHGVDRSRMTIIALGEQRPVAPNALPDGAPDEAGRAANRRVTVTIAPPANGAAASEEVSGEAAPASDG